MSQTKIAVPPPPSAVRVALIWLTLSVASVAGFASANPLAAPDQVAATPQTALGSQSGLIAADVMLGGSHEIPFGTARWTELVAGYFEPQDVDLALRVIHCESSGRPEATNPDSGAAGLFQHLPSYWDERATSASVTASAFNPEANIAVASWLVYQGGGWRHWDASRQCWSPRSALR